jgi:peptidyl-prolyl cis-trans isomerase A (cyclophilin A)
MICAYFTTTIALAAALTAPVAPAAQSGTTAPPQPKKPATTAPAKPATSQPAKPATAQPKKTTPPATAPVAKAPAGRGAATTSTAMSAAAKAKLKNPAALKDIAPAEFSAAFDTSAGPFVIRVHRAWAPKGADRFYNMVKYGFFDNARFFRVVPNFMVQFGINGDPTIQAPWRDANLIDDPVTQSNKRGMVTFAKTGAPNSRSTQIFINFRDNGGLDRQGFAPFGEILSGMEAVDKITAEYGESPDQMRIQSQGNAYLAKEFPRLDFVKKATIVRAPAPAAAPKKK